MCTGNSSGSLNVHGCQPFAPRHKDYPWSVSGTGKINKAAAARIILKQKYTDLKAFNKAAM
jgi:hypothetical protein